LHADDACRPAPRAVPIVGVLRRSLCAYWCATHRRAVPHARTHRASAAQRAPIGGRKWPGGSTPSTPVPHARTHRASAAQRAPIGAVLLPRRARAFSATPRRRLGHESMITPQHARARPWPRPPLMLRQWPAAARGGHRRDARSRAALACRYHGRWLHGARCGAGHASVAAARDGRGRGGGARLG
jgi:hypothetical protein